MLHEQQVPKCDITRHALAIIFAALLSPGVFADLTVRNNTPYCLRASVLGDPGFNFRMYPNGFSLSHPVSGNQSIVGMKVDVEVEDADGCVVPHEFDWQAIVATLRDGFVEIEYTDRPNHEFGPWNITLWVESYDDAGRTVMRSTSDGTAYDTSRSVRFLATADCQHDQNDTTDWNDNSTETAGIMTDRLLGDVRIRGILNAGDLTWNCFDEELEMYRNSISGFSRFWFDGLGNHDYGAEAADELLAHVRDNHRNTPKARRDPTGHPHYSWDWHDVHFVQLNLYPGNCPSGHCGNSVGFHNPYDALSFLISDLQDHVSTTCRPVVLVHHYGFDSFSIGQEPPNFDEWWTAAQRRAYWDAIANYNVIAIFTGHWHLSPGSRIQYNFMRPQPDAGGPPFIPSFICGAAGNRAFLDVTIDAAGALDIRKMSGDAQIGSLQVSGLPELFVSPFSFPTGDGSQWAPHGEIRQSLAYVQPSVPACRSTDVALILAPGQYGERIATLGELVIDTQLTLRKWDLSVDDVVIGAP